MIIRFILFFLTSMSINFAHADNGIFGESTFKVKGMVCSFCAQGITKKFNEMENVKSVDVDLDTMEVKVSLKDGTSLTEKDAKKVIEDSGFSYEGIKKNEEK